MCSCSKLSGDKGAIVSSATIAVLYPCCVDVEFVQSAMSGMFGGVYTLLTPNAICVCQCANVMNVSCICHQLC